MNSTFTKSMCAAALLTLLSTSALFAQDDEPVARAQPVADAEPTRAEPIASATPDVRPLSVTVELISGKTQITGTLTDTTNLDMRTSFGMVAVPLSEVAGFRFPSADDASTTVVMLNGDSITGATDVKMVTVETEWGVAQINGQSIQSILFVPGLAWTSAKGLNGVRWGLSNQTSTTSQNLPASSSSSSSIRSSSPAPSAIGSPPRIQNFGQPFNN
ncbi:hypothetical protein [Stieleria varia]|uniref:Uncharacterized protein n=1 Tax=Stieleria varia TaxID=2528005 RepID=A0A5C6A4V7_9BACT|nr:hypothetical protein [Stieleria varia]TWT94509.1 hypothetical protein Pla52n_53300 [Stieleria varia]